MLVVLLRFSDNKDKARELMPGHNDWISRGFEDGVFLLAGTLQPKLGGAILARGVSRQELEERVKRDPFVSENVVSVEILEITPARADDRLRSLLG